ncbi:hypothetical protein FHT86_006666 [Rhizobium sp. BK313]|uniref:hypothetical protein n=1 Tax=Rhizobium sp. BK313 TaxID=2587081 RepID=UPI001060FCED|nr:hypothetical protein [Rhizobium sp. BK313]MBB3458341.1 hypothetical protein [Rhizobium sp. BK313]
MLFRFAMILMLMALSTGAIAIAQETQRKPDPSAPTAETQENSAYQNCLLQYNYLKMKNYIEAKCKGLRVFPPVTTGIPKEQQEQMRRKTDKTYCGSACEGQGT